MGTHVRSSIYFMVRVDNTRNCPKVNILMILRFKKKTQKTIETIAIVKRQLRYY